MEDPKQHTPDQPAKPAQEASAAPVVATAAVVGAVMTAGQNQPTEPKAPQQHKTVASSFNPMAINYTALDPKKKIDPRQFSEEELRAVGFNNPLGAPIAISIAFALIFIALSVNSTSATQRWTLIIIGLVLPAILVFFLNLRSKASNYPELRHLKFAKDNHMRYRTDKGQGLKKIAPPEDVIVFQAGARATRCIRNIYATPDKAVIFGTFYYENNPGGRNRDPHWFDFLCVPLQRKLPHIIINSKSNDGLSLENTLRGDHIKRLTMSGNFSDLFEVFIPVGYQIDALQVLTPDVMWILTDYGEYFDFEIVDDQLYIFMPNGAFADPIKAQTKLVAGQRIAEALCARSHYYRDNRATEGFDENNIAEAGRLARFTRSQVGVVGVASIVIAVLAEVIGMWGNSEYSGSSGGMLSAVFVGLFVFGIFGFVAFIWIRKARQAKKYNDHSKELAAKLGITVSEDQKNAN